MSKSSAEMNTLTQAHSRNSSSDSEGKAVNLKDIFGFEFEHVHNERPAPEFWQNLSAQLHDADIVGSIDTKFIEDKLAAKGVCNIRATKVGNQTRLEIVDGAEAGEHIQKVYFLPHVLHDISTVSRADLDRSECDFFLTTPLTGCRFVVTKEVVSHVFASAGGNDNSLSRDKAQERAGIPTEGPNLIRSFSASEYGGRGFACGVKVDGKWAFKTAAVKPEGKTSWTKTQC